MIRKAIREMSGYTPGEQSQKKVIKLNTNENPYPLPESYYETLRSMTGENLRLYPDPLCKNLREQLAAYHSVNPGNILCGNGSDEILRLAFDLVLEPGDEVGIFEPTYSLYPVLTDIREGVLKSYHLNENGLPNDEPFSFTGKIFLIASPNPPYGNCIPRQWISSFLRSFKGLVVIDEAYVDFSDETWIQDIMNYPNLLVTRTYSKSFSLAGIRFGYGLADTTLINEMYKIKDSYNVNSLTQFAALTALEYLDVINENIQKIVDSRELLTRELANLGLKVYPSNANFIFFECSRAKKVYEYLKQYDIFIRYFDTPRLSRGLRVTVGTPQECDLFLLKLKEFLYDKG